MSTFVIFQPFQRREYHLIARSTGFAHLSSANDPCPIWDRRGGGHPKVLTRGWFWLWMFLNYLSALNLTTFLLHHTGPRVPLRPKRPKAVAQPPPPAGGMEFSMWHTLQWRMCMVCKNKVGFTLPKKSNWDSNAWFSHLLVLKPTFWPWQPQASDEYL